METPSSSFSQFEGVTAGFESVLMSIKKRICCEPTAEGQERRASVAVELLKEPLEALEAVLDDPDMS